MLVAVSGGVDSMVLLHVLHRLSTRHNWRLVVAHFNHCLRGPASDADERFVLKSARKLGLRCVTIHADVKSSARRQYSSLRSFLSGVTAHADVKSFARTNKLSLEMAARQLRHEFLARTARQLKIPTVALAHHADDQVELFFLRLLRGTGSEGLAGMKRKNPSPADREIELVRPLLDQPKAALEAFARQENIPFRVDRTNTALDFQRNRIRHELIPWLTKKYQPALHKTTVRLMDILSGEAEFAEQAARTWLTKNRGIAFDQWPLAVQRRFLQRKLLELGVEPDFELIEKLRQSADRPVSVKPDLALYRNAAGIVRSRRTESLPFNSDQARVELSGKSGACTFAGLSVSWRIQSESPGRHLTPKRAPSFEVFDADKVGSVVLLRHWRAGDRFQPIGMVKPLKLQDLFTNLKVPPARRRTLVVAATAQGEIFWVEGVRISECFKLDKQTVRRLKWQWQRL